MFNPNPLFGLKTITRRDVLMRRLNALPDADPARPIETHYEGLHRCIAISIEYMYTNQTATGGEIDLNIVADIANIDLKAPHAYALVRECVMTMLEDADYRVTAMPRGYIVRYSILKH